MVQKDATRVLLCQSVQDAKVYPDIATIYGCWMSNSSSMETKAVNPNEQG